MKSILINMVFFLIYSPLCGDITLESSLKGIKKEDELFISACEDLRMEKGGFYPWSCSLFLDIPAPSASKEKSSAPVLWGASLATDHVSLGRLILTGAYDHLESRTFPSLYSWEWGPRLTLEKKTAFNERWGGAIHDRQKRFIIHYLDYPGYSQGGLFYNIGDNTLGMEGGILSSSLEGKAGNDTSWYDPDLPRPEEDLIHIQGTLKLGLPRKGRLWNLRCEGALLLPELSRKVSRVMISLSFHGKESSISLLTGVHSGSWISCSGEEADWNRGVRMGIHLFEESPINVKGEGLLWFPKEGAWPSFTGHLAFEREIFALFGQVDYDSPESLFSWMGGSRLSWIGEWGYLEGEGKWNKDTNWKETLTLRGEIRTNNLICTSLLSLGREEKGNFFFELNRGELVGELGLSFSLHTSWEMNSSVRVIVEEESPGWGEYQFRAVIRGKY